MSERTHEEAAMAAEAFAAAQKYEEVTRKLLEKKKEELSNARRKQRVGRLLLTRGEEVAQEQQEKQDAKARKEKTKGRLLTRGREFMHTASHIHREKRWAFSFANLRISQQMLLSCDCIFTFSLDSLISKSITQNEKMFSWLLVHYK